MSDLVSLVAIVIAEIRNLFSVRRYDGRVVRTLARGKRRERAAFDIDAEDFAVLRIAFPVCAAVRGEHDAPAVRREGQRAVVVELALGELPGSATLGRDDEHVLIARLEVALAIDAIHHRIDDLDRRRPLRALGLLGWRR